MICSHSLKKLIAFEMVERKVRREVFGNWMVKMKMGKEQKGKMQDKREPQKQRIE